MKMKTKTLTQRQIAKQEQQKITKMFEAYAKATNKKQN